LGGAVPSPRDPFGKIRGGRTVSTQRPRNRTLALLPLAVLLILGVLLAFATSRGPPVRKSALIGKPAPAFDLPAIDGLSAPGLSRADLGRGKPVIVNFWASWCIPCREEQPALEALARATHVELVGINYKDDPAAAQRFLAEYGNPFARIGADGDGRAGIEWGIGGVPETFYLGPDGRILAHREGPVDARLALRWSQNRP
jgi:cytochrome c biogenesis protein CcmG/thiol:disulfide interchange protein DsbE